MRWGRLKTCILHLAQQRNHVTVQDVIQAGPFAVFFFLMAHSVLVLFFRLAPCPQHVLLPTLSGRLPHVCLFAPGKHDTRQDQTPPALLIDPDLPHSDVFQVTYWDNTRILWRPTRYVRTAELTIHSWDVDLQLCILWDPRESQPLNCRPVSPGGHQSFHVQGCRVEKFNDAWVGQYMISGGGSYPTKSGETSVFIHFDSLRETVVSISDCSFLLRIFVTVKGLVFEWVIGLLGFGVCALAIVLSQRISRIRSRQTILPL